MKTPLISAVVPIYNVERYIKVCIDSILAQTFQDFEIIIVDDASPDNSYNICQKLYGDNEKIRIIRQKENLGEGETRNTGIVHTGGKYIYLMDSDDFIFPNALEILYNAAESSGAEIVHASQYYETTQDDDQPIDFDKLTFDKDPYQTEGFISTDILYRWENCWNRWDKGIRPLVWLNLYRREIFEKYPLKFEPINSEDELFYFEIFTYAEKFFVINQAFYVYRQRENSVMKTKKFQRLTRGILALFVIIDKIKSVMNNFPELRGNRELQERFIFRLLLGHFNNHIKIFYEDGFNADTDIIAEKILSEVFGKNTTLVKFLFHSLAITRNEYEATFLKNKDLIQERLDFEQQVMQTMSNLKILRNKIVFYGDDLKLIAEEILKQKLPCEMVMIVKDEEEKIPAQIRKVLAGSVDMIYELSTAKIIVSNVEGNLPFIKKDKQILITDNFASKKLIDRIKKLVG